jgi:hypothetical protein
MPLTQVKTSNLDTTNSLLFRNRIINGDMRIDQRNAGASTTPTASGYTLDRFQVIISATSKFSVQQNAGSVTPPAGFTNYLGTTSLAATSISSGDYYQVSQTIEGYNIADLAWGTASAKTITISFWARSSLTGSFGGALLNVDNTRSYPYSYTINSSNTWEYKTITIPGETTGTWNTTNGIGLQFRFSLGMGSTYTTTGGAWANGVYGAPTGSVNVVSTNGATLYITGVQFEVGTAATAFERRPYGTELQLCQRYYFKTLPNKSAGLNAPITNIAFAQSATIATGSTNFPVTMRTRPTALEQSGTAADYATFIGSGGMTTCSAVPTFYDSTTDVALTTFTSSGMTAWQAGYCRSQATAAYLAWSAEL